MHDKHDNYTATYSTQYVIASYIAIHIVVCLQYGPAWTWKWGQLHDPYTWLRSQSNWPGKSEIIDNEDTFIVHPKISILHTLCIAIATSGHCKSNAH